MALAHLLWVVLCLQIGFESTTATGSGRTYTEAKRYCENKGGLPIPRSQKEHDALRGKLERFGISSIWLKGERQTLREWTWVNGTKSGITHSHGSQKCAGFDQRREDIFIDDCTFKAPGHICEAKQCKDCYQDFGYKGQVCRKFGGKCFLFHCDNKNWFNSRAACGNESQDLGIIQNNDMVKWLSKLKFYCTRFWIGLRRETWTEKGEPESFFSKWGTNEPSEGNCMILEVVNGETYWASSHCSQERGTICSGTEEFSIGISKQTYIATTPKEDGNNTNSRVILIVVLTVVVILLATLILGIALFKAYKKKVFCFGEQATGEHSEMEHPLVSRPSLKVLQDHLAEKSKGYCDVKMSHDDDHQWFEPVGNIYTDVKITKGRKTLTFTELMEEIKRNTRNRILFSGNPGVGKTTVGRKILHEWIISLRHGESGSSGENFRFVCFIMLSKISKEWTFKKVLKKLLHLCDEDAEHIYSDIDEHQDNCLIILDGFDGATHTSSICNDIMKMIKGVMFPKVKVIMTCRLPTRIYLDQHWSVFKDHYVIDGFTESSIKSFISKLPSSYKVNVSKILKTEALNRLAAYPNSLRFLCNIWQDDITSLTVHKAFVEYSFTRYKQKFPSTELDQQSFEKHVSKLGEIALEKLHERGKNYFHINDIQLIRGVPLQLGLCVFHEKKIGFPSDQFHAYLCAYYLAQADKETRAKRFKKLFSDENVVEKAKQIIECLAGMVIESPTKVNVLRDELSEFADWKEKFETSLKDLEKL